MKQHNLDAISLQCVCIKTNVFANHQNLIIMGICLCFIASEAKKWCANVLKNMPVVYVSAWRRIELSSILDADEKFQSVGKQIIFLTYVIKN